LTIDIIPAAINAAITLFLIVLNDFSDICL
jgi:hypothetical protein